MTPHPPPAPELAIAALARDLEQARRRLAALAKLPEQLQELVDRVTALGERIAVPGAKGSRPVTWLGFPRELDAAIALLTNLIDWMDSVYLRYPDAAQSLPDCWLWHPDVIEELLWLRQAWAAAYGSSATSIGPVGDWHERQRPGVVRRIRTAAGACAIESHTNDGHPRCSPMVGAIPAIAQWWTSARSSPAPPPNAPPRDTAGGQP